MTKQDFDALLKAQASSLDKETVELIKAAWENGWESGYLVATNHAVQMREMAKLIKTIGIFREDREK